MALEIRHELGFFLSGTPIARYPAKDCLLFPDSREHFVTPTEMGELSGTDGRLAR